MNRYKTWLKCILIVILLRSSVTNAKQTIKAVPEEVNLGTFNAFVIKETVVTLENTGKDTFVIDKIKADCACIRTSIDTKEIPAGKTTELKIAAMERTGGKFSQNVLITSKDTEKHEPLKIQVTGDILEPVSAQVGWLAKKMKRFDPNIPLELEPIHQLSAEPVIYITSNDKKLNFKTLVPDVNSSGFELKNYKIEKFSSADKNQNMERMVLNLKPKDTLKIGEIRQGIKVELTDNVLLYIPLMSRIFGDVYINERRISFGPLANGENKEIEIHFVNNAKPWKNMKWEVNGSLSDTINVIINRSKCTDSCIVADLAVNKSTLRDVPKGYNFSRLNFFQDGSKENDVVSVLIDGFN